MIIYLASLDTQEEKDRFICLYETYSKRMWYIANKILGDEFLAEDIVHDAFIKISKHFDKFSGKSHNEVSKLIVTIVKHLAIDALRRRKNIKFVPLNDQMLSDENIINDPVEIVISQNQYLRLVDRFSGLDEHYASVLKLKWSLDYSNKEIAELLNIKEDNVRLRLHRGRLELMAILCKEEENDV